LSVINATGFSFDISVLFAIAVRNAFGRRCWSQLQESGCSKPSCFVGKPTNIAIETACLLLSSFTCGMSAVASGVRNLVWTQVALLVTGLLGVAFLVLEANDFAELVAQGFGPQRSAFLSSFFAVVGCHGLHVSAGLLWLGTMMAQIFVKGFRADILRRMLCFNLFWHVLDIIWVALFTIVYLIGEGR
jgi:cytochrome o ubiquinol oxidase subunit III